MIKSSLNSPAGDCSWDGLALLELLRGLGAKF